MDNMARGDRVIEIDSGRQYIVFDCMDDEICVLDFFSYSQFPYNRQLTIWKDKNKFVKGE
jgi:hypothetical protein